MRIQRLYHPGQTRLHGLIALDHLLYYVNTNGGIVPERPTLLLNNMVFLEKPLVHAVLRHPKAHLHVLPQIQTILSTYQWELSWIWQPTNTPRPFAEWIDHDGLANGSRHPSPDDVQGVLCTYAYALYAVRRKQLAQFEQFFGPELFRTFIELPEDPFRASC